MNKEAKAPGLPEISGEEHIDINIKGKTYTVYGPTVGDYSGFLARIEKKKKERALQVLKELKEAGVGDEFAVKEYRAELDRDMDKSEIGSLMYSLEEARFFFISGVNRKGEVIKSTEIEEIIDESNWRSILDQMFTIFPKGEEEKNPEGDPAPRE